MTKSKKLLERMKEHNINSYDELCHYLRVHDAAFINDLSADAIEAFIADLSNANTYILHMCITCRYWERIKDKDGIPRRICTRPELKKPCYAFRQQNWEWNGKPKSED